MSPNYTPTTEEVRAFLATMTYDEFIGFCQDNFPEIYLKFAPTMLLSALHSTLIDRYLIAPKVRWKLHRLMRNAEFSMPPKSAGEEDTLDLPETEDAGSNTILKGVENQDEPTPANAPSEPHADVAIITSSSEELQAVLDLSGGRERWERLTLERYLHYRTVWMLGGRELTVVACSQARAGGDETTAAVARLARLNPRLLVMSGVCSGREGAVELGDLIVADRAYRPEEGFHTTTCHQSDTRTFHSPPWLMQRLRDFARDRDWHRSIVSLRPVSPRYQAEWLLCEIDQAGTDFPNSDADWQKLVAAGISAVVARDYVRHKGWLHEDKTLTADGRTQLRELRWGHNGKLQPRADRAAPEVLFGAFASVTPVVAVDDPFQPLLRQVQRALAIEHEVSSLFEAATRHGIPAFAIKGVVDYATPEQDTLFHAYAAEAAARWIYAFLRSFEL